MSKTKQRLFELPTVRKNVHRSPFDLQGLRIYSATAGKIECPYSRLCYPGDKFKLNISNLTRTKTLNSAAFTRAKEHWNWHFVPLRLLWKYFPDHVIQNSQSDSAQTPVRSGTPTQAPRVWLPDLMGSFYRLVPDTDPLDKDEMGFKRWPAMVKLLQQMRFGYQTDDPETSPSITTPEKYVNIWRPLAYQKVYQDFYRNTQWESYDPTSFNVDYLSSLSDGEDVNVIPLKTLDDWKNHANMFTARYANYKKDMFFGLRPSAQFGDIQVVSVSTDSAQISNGVETELETFSSTSAGTLVTGLGLDSNTDRGLSVTLKGTFDILSLRKAEALQRLKEIQQAADWRYNSQIQRIFDFHVPDSRAQIAEYIGGVSNSLHITDVDATAAGETSVGSETFNSALGQIGGKGVMASDANEFTYECKEHGVLLLTYYISPEPVFPAIGLDHENEELEYSDYPNPVLENIGLEGIRGHQINADGRELPGEDTDLILGYGPRYLNKKTDVDLIFDEFVNGGSMDYWTTSVPTDRLSRIYDNRGLDYRFFKVAPDHFNPIFALSYNGYAQTCPFFVFANINVTAIRPFSVDGMPY